VDIVDEHLWRWWLLDRLIEVDEENKEGILKISSNKGGEIKWG
jgi:ATP-dependent 26S proteasome regulatory subunit